MALELGDLRREEMKINKWQKRQRSCWKRTQNRLRNDSARKVKRQDLDLIERELQEQDALIEKLSNLLKGCKEKCKRINEKVDELIREVRKLKLQQKFYQINYLNIFGHRPLRHRDVNANPYPEVLIPFFIFHTFSNSEEITESLSDSKENNRKKEESSILFLQNRIPDGFGTTLPIREESALDSDMLKSLKSKLQRNSEKKLAIDKNYRCLSCPPKFSK